MYHDSMHTCGVVGPNHYMRTLYHVTKMLQRIPHVPADVCDMSLATDPTE